MSDYRNTDYRKTDRPSGGELANDSANDANARGDGVLAWIAGVVLVVILLALAVGISHNPAPNTAGANVAANNAPTLNRLSPTPSSPASRAYTPAPINPSNPLPLKPANPQPKP